jgi:DNA-binding NtrC family response regulator
MKEEAEKKLKVLVVDDEETIRKSIKKRLNKEGYDVITAESGDEAISILNDTKFNLLILDYRMKGMDGLQLLKIIRRKEGDLPVIMMTGTSSMRPEDFIREGASDCLIKPISKETLIEAVKKAIDKGK